MLDKHQWEGKLQRNIFALALLKSKTKAKRLLKKPCFGFRVVKERWVRDEKLTNQSS